MNDTCLQIDLQVYPMTDEIMNYLSMSFSRIEISNQCEKICSCILSKSTRFFSSVLSIYSEDASTYFPRKSE